MVIEEFDIEFISPNKHHQGVSIATSENIRF